MASPPDLARAAESPSTGGAAGHRAPHHTGRSASFSYATEGHRRPSGPHLHGLIPNDTSISFSSPSHQRAEETTISSDSSDLESDAESSEYEDGEQHPLAYGVILERPAHLATQEHREEENASTASHEQVEATPHLPAPSTPGEHNSGSEDVTYPNSLVCPRNTPVSSSTRASARSPALDFDPDNSYFVVHSGKKSWDEYVELASPDASHSD